MMPLSRLVGMSFGLLVWGAHFLACYILVAIVCQMGVGQSRWMGVPAAPLVVGLLTVAAAGLLLLDGLTDLAKIRRQGGVVDDGHPAGFLVASRLGISILSLVAVLWVGFSGIIVPACR